MQRQDSTTDQIESVAVAVAETLPDAARKIREDKADSLDDEEYGRACQIAVDTGCYDAHDWLLRQWRPW